MAEMLSAIPRFALFFVLLPFLYGKDLSNGWNEKIDWKDLKTALKESEELKKPVMLVIHKSWCGACKALKPKFAESSDIEELSSNFIMVNTLDDDEPPEAKYKPDGGYIPRILFIDNGEVAEDLYNKQGNPKYKYYYHNTDTVLKTMRRAIERFGESTGRPSDEL